MGTKIIGRPSIYSEELALSICDRLAGGESLRSVCRDKGIPSRQTIIDWLLTNKHFLDQYEAARNLGYDELFDELNEIADLSDDEESPMRSRLRVDTRKWYLSKVLPKKYGDKLDMTSGGERIQFQPLTSIEDLQQNVRKDNSNQQDSEPLKED